MGLRLQCHCFSNKYCDCMFSGIEDNRLIWIPYLNQSTLARNSFRFQFCSENCNVFFRAKYGKGWISLRKIKRGHVLFYHLWEYSCKISTGLAKGLSPFLKKDYCARFLCLQAPRHVRANWSKTVIILLASISFTGEITVCVFINTTIVTKYRKKSIHRYEDP